MTTRSDFLPNPDQVTCVHCGRGISNPTVKCEHCRCYIHQTCLACPHVAPPDGYAPAGGT